MFRRDATPSPIFVLSIPLRSGVVYILEEAGRKVFRGASVAGYAWPSSAIGEAKDWSVYYLDFHDGDVYPSGGPTSRRFGFPLRCLSTTAVGKANLVRSGITDVYYGWLGYNSVSGYIWSRSILGQNGTIPVTSTAYVLDFDASGTYPSYGPHYRWNGFPLRCLSTTAVGTCAAGLFSLTKIKPQK